MFLKAQELDCQHMRALNLDQMELAQLMRERLQMIDSAVSDIQVPLISFSPPHHDSAELSFQQLPTTRAGEQQIHRLCVETGFNELV